MRRHLLVLCFIVSGPLLICTGAIAQPPEPLTPQTLLGTGFTYQGQLKDAAGPVNGTCDLQFSLWDAASAGVPIGTTQTESNVAVAGGRSR